MNTTVYRYYYDEASKSTVVEAVQCINRELYDSRYASLKAAGFTDSLAMFYLVQQFLLSQDPYQKVKDEWYRIQSRIEFLSREIAKFSVNLNDIQRAQKVALENELDQMLNNRNRLEAGRYNRTTTDWRTEYDNENIPHRVQGTVTVEVVLPEDSFYPWLAFYRGVYTVSPPEYAVSAQLMESFELTEYKIDAMIVVDEQAELERLKIISPGSGLAAIYIFKADEATRLMAQYESNPDFEPTEEEFPFMFGEVGITSDSPKGVAEVILTNQRIWTAIGGQIESIRLNAKKSILEATKRSEVSDIMTNLRWALINPVYF